MMDDDALKDYLPVSFGGTTSDGGIEAQIEKARRPGFAKKQSAKNDSDDEDNAPSDDSDDDESDDEAEFPITHEVVFKTHDKAITSIALDASGARMITGSTDCTLKFHDFASMAPNTIRAFKSLDPSETKASANTEGHAINNISFNPNSPSQILVVSALPQAKILSRDGEVEYETIKGDMYLRDMNMTKGHISEITAGVWHPNNGNCFATAGTDSTLRIWDQNIRNKQRDVIVHKSKLPGAAGRSRMTAVSWGVASEGHSSNLVSASLDGSLLMWPGEGPYHRPIVEIKDAHIPDKWTSGIDISSDGRLVITRGGDDTIKLWDTRKFKTPVTTATHPSTSSQYPTSNIIFGPNSNSILTGSPEGSLYILNPATLKPEVVTPVTPGSSLITVQWHPKLNQIVTGSANAETHIIFDPRTSTKGALSILSRLPKRRHIDDDQSLTTDNASLGISGDSINNNGVSGDSIQTSTFASRHPTIGLTASGKSRDPRRPHLPAVTPFAKSNPDEKHIRESIPFSSMREEDPREALLKYADKAKNDPMFTKAWAKTQPKTIYGDVSDDETEDGKRKRQKT